MLLSPTLVRPILYISRVQRVPATGSCPRSDSASPIRQQGGKMPYREASMPFGAELLLEKTVGRTKVWLGNIDGDVCFLSVLRGS